MPKRDLSNALRGMGVRAGQRLQLDEPALAPVALVTEEQPESESMQSAAASNVEVQSEENLSTVAPADESKRRGKKSQASNAKHMGTIETPYVRQRDGMPTRKVSVILPVDLARELQIFCVTTGRRTNTFHEEALRAALSRAKSRSR